MSVTAPDTPADRRPLEIWLPAVARLESAPSWRLAIERADRLPAAPMAYLDRLAAHFQGDDGELPIAALTRNYLHGDAGEGAWLCADPAWVQPDMNGARLLACGQMQLDDEEAEALAEPLRPLFAEAGIALELSSPDRWHLRLPDGLALPPFDPPELAMGEDLFLHLPQGAEGRTWRILFNDVQVTLHQHPVNAARRARGLPPVNSLWLWGGGRLPSSWRSDLRGVIGDDLVLLAMARRAGAAVRERHVEALAEAGPGWLLDLQDIAADQLESIWWPALQARLRRQALQLVCADGQRCLLKPWHRWRFWRRAVPTARRSGAAT